MPTRTSWRVRRPLAWPKCTASGRRDWPGRVTVEIHPDFSDLLRSFNEEHVRYLVVGAYALAVHGRPRATKDLDVWVARDKDNAERLFRALARFGAPLDAVSAADFADPETVFQIGVAPIRIDILTSIDGVDFEDAWPGRIDATFGDLTISVIGRDAFVRNKLRVGRARDLADVEDIGGVTGP